jgi:iron-sulfur cluster assembly protein
VLAISAAAPEGIKGLVAASDLPDNAGVRISGHPEGSGVFDPSLTPEAAEADEVVEERGATVFVDGQVAPLLDDKTLDAHFQGDKVAFTIVKGGNDEPDA